MTQLHTRLKSMADTFAKSLSITKKEARKLMFEIAHPIGSHLITKDPRNPSQYIGGGNGHW